MKLLHIADTHLGKRVRGFSLIEEQAYALAQVEQIARDEGVQAVLLAGDVFDKPIPPVEALELFERFARGLAETNIRLIVSAGNHDSAQRLAFNASFLKETLIIGREFEAKPQFIDLAEADGGITRIHLLPFVKPAFVRAAYPDELPEGATYTDAVRVACAHQPILDNAANILMAHQFVVAAGTETQLCDSESVFVGGVDSVDVSAFNAFDYVALGHIHTPQHIGRPTVRYSGSLYPYSASEAGRPKEVVVIDTNPPSHNKDELDNKANKPAPDSSTPAPTAGSTPVSPSAPTSNSTPLVTFARIPLKELRTLRIIEGTFEEIKHAHATDTHADDYVFVHLHDDSLINAMEKIRALYPRCMQLDFKRAYEANSTAYTPRAHTPEKSTLTWFEEFIESQTGEKLSPDVREKIENMIEELA